MLAVLLTCRCSSSASAGTTILRAFQRGRLSLRPSQVSRNSQNPRTKPPLVSWQAAQSHCDLVMATLHATPIRSRRIEIAACCARLLD